MQTQFGLATIANIAVGIVPNDYKLIVRVGVCEEGRGSGWG